MGCFAQALPLCCFRTQPNRQNLIPMENTACKMQVLLRDTVTSLYYAGGNTFTPDPVDAANFREIGCAIWFAVERHFSSMEVVLNYSAPFCQIVIPLRPEWAASDSEPPLPKAA